MHARHDDDILFFLAHLKRKTCDKGKMHEKHIQNARCTKNARKTHEKRKMHEKNTKNARCTKAGKTQDARKTHEKRKTHVKREIPEKRMKIRTNYARCTTHTSKNA
jgi:hypothetical protein